MKAKEYSLKFRNTLHKDKVTTTLSNGEELSIPIQNPYKGFTYGSRATLVKRIRKDLKELYTIEEMKLLSSKEVMFITITCGYAMHSEVMEFNKLLKTHAQRIEGETTDESNKIHGVHGAGIWKVYSTRPMLAGLLMIKNSSWHHITGWGPRYTELMKYEKHFEGAIS